MYEPKTKPTKVSVTDFIAEIDNETRRADAKTLLKLFKDVTGVKPTMWGPTIIGFGSYEYFNPQGQRGGEMCRVGFSPRKANLVLYISMRNDKNDPLRAKLGKHKTGVSCLYINKLTDIDMAVLRAMVARGWSKGG